MNGRRCAGAWHTTTAGTRAHASLIVPGMQLHRSLLAIALTGYVLLCVGTALTRQPYTDEGELASPAYTLVHRGYMTVTQWEEHRASHKAYWMPPVFFLAEGAWQSLVGFGVVQFRLASVVSGLLVLVGTYSIVSRLTGESTLALLVLSLLGLDYTFLQHAGVGRCEVMSLAFGIGATAAYMKLREQSLSLALVSSHALMALSALTHPVGALLWMPALLGVQGYLDLNRYNLQSMMQMAAPYVVGLVAWGLYIVRNPAEFVSQFQVSVGMGRMSGFGNPFVAVKRELTERFLAYYGVRPTATALVRAKMILPLGYAFGLTGAVLIPSALRCIFLRLAMILFCVQFGILAIVEGTKQFHYIVHVIPTLAMILGAGVWLAWRERLFARCLLVAGVATLFVLQIGPTLFRVREDRYRQDFLPVVDYIRPSVERGEVLISQAEFAIPFGFPENLVTDPGYGWRRVDRPRLVVVDEAVMEKNAAGAREATPNLYRYLTREFPAEYRPVFTRGQYTVYERRDQDSMIRGSVGMILVCE